MANPLGLLAHEERTKLTTHQRALRMNLDPSRYDTFAEIGAEQEVALVLQGGGRRGNYREIEVRLPHGRQRCYLRPQQALCLARALNCMFEYEHRLNLERLGASRGDNTAFFTFADTVAARNYQGTNECHG